MYRVALVLAVLAACAADDDKPAPKCADGRTAVTIATGGPAASAMYRDGDGDWEPAGALDSAHVQVCADDDYVLFMTCTDASDQRHITRQFAATAGDGDQSFSRPCVAPPPPAPKTVVASFTASEPGTLVFRPSPDLVPLHVDAYEQGEALPVANYDIVASTDPEFPAKLPLSLYVRSVAADRDGAPATAIDFAEAKPIAHRSLAITGRDPGEEVTVNVSWSLPMGGLFTFPGTSTSVWSASPDLIAHGGDQWLDVLGEQREISIKYDGQTDIALPARLDGIEVDDVGAAWTKLPAHERVQFLRYTTTAEVFAIATKAWLDGHHARSIALDVTAPGYDEGWTDARNPEWDRYFEVQHFDDDTSISVWTWDRATQP